MITATALPGIREVGLIVVVWATSSLIFQELVVRFDVELVQRLSGTTLPETEIDRYRRRLGTVSRWMLAIGLLMFLGSVALLFARH